MYNKIPKIIRFILTVLIATLISLSSHIFLWEFFNVRNFYIKNLYQDYTPSQPNSIIMNLSTYATYLEQIFILAIAYYFISDLIKTNKLTKISLFTAILLGLHGNLILAPIMSATMAYASGVKHFILITFLGEASQWVSTFLLVSALVFFCPSKKCEYTLLK